MNTSSKKPKGLQMKSQLLMLKFKKHLCLLKSEEVELETR